jgi:chromosomal replication initiation ATPase DnaA
MGGKTMTAERTHQFIVTEVAKKFDISIDDIMGRTRTTHIALARMVCMAAMWQAGFSYPQVGKHFKRNHATVMHAVKKTGAKRKAVNNSKNYLPD